MRVEESLLHKKRAVDRELEQLLYREDSSLFQAMRYAVFPGGKRFRPLLILSCGECFHVSQNFLLPFASAIELIHNYSLIHDDLPSMDNDDLRRGKPSCHKAFGEDIALLAGDSLLTLAFEVLAQAPLPAALYPQKEQVIREISQAAGARGMIGGQYLDITLTPEKLSEEALDELILKKTGSLIIVSVRVAAIVGKASPSQLEAVSEYGKNIGLAFQIRDDIMDSTEEGNGVALSRPNYVSCYGIQESKKRLRRSVASATGALYRARLESRELRYLAMKLQELGRESKDA